MKMKTFDFTQKVLDFEGNEIVSDNKPLTYMDIAMKACGLSQEHDTAENKFSDYQIAIKIYAKPEAVKLELEERTRLKNKIGKLFPVITVGRMWQFLES